LTLVLAAAEPALAELPDTPLLADLAAAVGAKRAAALASELTGLPRNRIYARLTEKRGV
jgi:hypothetical protein